MTLFLPVALRISLFHPNLRMRWMSLVRGRSPLLLSRRCCKGEQEQVSASGGHGRGKDGKVKGHTTRPGYFTHVVQHLVPEVLLLVCEVSVGGVRGAAGPEEGHAGGAPDGSGLRGHDVHRGRAQAGQGAEGRPLQQGGGHSPHQGSHGRLRRGPEQLRREREQCDQKVFFQIAN